MTDRLSLYNGAMRLLKERRITSLTEDNEARRLLDDVWDNGGVKTCLEAGEWNWAARVQSLPYSSSQSVDVGWQYAFEEPTDIVRILGVSDDANFSEPMERYERSGGFFFADIEVLYIRYVSDDSRFGLDFSLWPEAFARFVEAYFAEQIAGNLTASDSMIARLGGVKKERLSDAEIIDARSGPAKSMGHYSWYRSRSSRTHRYAD